jgi:hypothetical protein
MKPVAVAGFLMLSTHALATATLDCLAKPYYLSVIVSNEHGPQQFSLSDESGELVAGETSLWKEFHLQWPNGRGPKGNSLRLRGQFANALSVVGRVSGAAGTLVVNGQKHAFSCDWRK